jgi:hypothetical protein
VQVEDDPFAPSFGPAANNYLKAHGYNMGALQTIEITNNSSENIQDFLGYLHPHGMPWMEIIYLWDLIQGDKE